MQNVLLCRACACPDIQGLQHERCLWQLSRVVRASGWKPNDSTRASNLIYLSCAGLECAIFFRRGTCLPLSITRVRFLHIVALHFLATRMPVLEKMDYVEIMDNAG